MQRLWSLSFFLFLFFPFLVRAESPPIVISEVAWAGSSASNADEWIELYNASGADMDLEGWTLTGAGSSGSDLVFPEGSVISASGTFIVANYDAGHEKTVLTVAPSWVTSSVSLSNASLQVTLLNGEGTEIDIAGDGSAPPAGQSGDEKRTMQRVFPAEDGAIATSWTSSEDELGTPGAILVGETDEKEPVTEPEEEEPKSGGGVVVDPLVTSIRISEIYPSPKSGEEEWVEIENISSVGEFLDGWTIEDAAGDPTNLEGLILPWAKRVILSPKGRLNNAGDALFLKDPKGRIIDAVSYGSANLKGFPHIHAPKKGQSLMRTEFQDTYLVTTTPTPNAKNVFTDPKPVEISPPAKSAPEPVSKPPVKKSIAPIKKDDAPRIVTAVTTPAPVAKPIAEKKPEPIKKTAITRKPRYKGRSYSATVAVPPGVYSKARMRVMVGGELRELRMTKSPTTPFASGDQIRFIAQEKQDGDAKYLLANIKTLYKTGTQEDLTFAETKAWPDAAGPYVLTGIIEEASGKHIQLKADGQSGIVESPVSYKRAGLQPGDLVSVKGYYEKGSYPRLVMLDKEALRVLEPAAPAMPTKETKKGLSLPAMIALTLLIMATGIAVYLRQERLRRARMRMNENTPL